MRQFIGKVRDESTVRDLLVSVAPERIRKAAQEIDRTELLMMERDSEEDQMAYAHALSPSGARRAATSRRRSGTSAPSRPSASPTRGPSGARSTLSGGEQKRLVLEALLRGPEVLLLDEPDNYLDVPTSAGWRTRSSRRPRRCCSSAMIASCSTASPSPPSSRVPWARRSGCTRGISRHMPRPARTGAPARGAAAALGRGAPQAQATVQTLKVKATYNDGMASRYRPPSCLAKFVGPGPPRARCTRTSGCASPEDGPPSVRSSRRTSS